MKPPNENRLKQAKNTLTRLIDLHKENWLHCQIDQDMDYNQCLAEEGTDYQLDLLVDKLIVDLNTVVDTGFVDLDNRDFEMVILKN